jgi:hypothetical protein
LTFSRATQQRVCQAGRTTGATPDVGSAAVVAIAERAVE